MKLSQQGFAKADGFGSEPITDWPGDDSVLILGLLWKNRGLGHRTEAECHNLGGQGRRCEPPATQMICPMVRNVLDEEIRQFNWLELGSTQYCNKCAGQAHNCTKASPKWY
jgi:hypothetical protein